MGKAARLRKNSATKMSLKDFHASLVKEKLVKKGSPSVKINFPDLEGDESEDNEAQDDVYDGDAYEDVLTGSSLGAKIQQRQRKEEHTPEAMEKIAQRLRSLKGDTNPRQPLSLAKSDDRRRSIETRAGSPSARSSPFGQLENEVPSSNESSSYPHADEASSSITKGRREQEDLVTGEELSVMSQGAFGQAVAAMGEASRTPHGFSPARAGGQNLNSKGTYGPTRQESKSATPRETKQRSIGEMYKSTGKDGVVDFGTIAGTTPAITHINRQKVGIGPLVNNLETPPCSAVQDSNVKASKASVKADLCSSGGPSSAYSCGNGQQRVGKVNQGDLDHDNSKGEATELSAPIQGTHNCKKAELGISSWSNLFGLQEQEKPSKLRQFNVELEGDEFKVPLEISKKGYLHWDYALVGYFFDKRNSFHYITTWAKKIWAEELKEVVTLDNGFYIFNVKNEDALKKILDGGPYYCGNRLILIKRWHPGMHLTKEEFSTIPIWIKFYNVPLELWTDEGLSYVASVIGKPLFLDEYTQKKTRLTFARICIEVQVEKDIPKSFKLNLGYGSPFEIKVEVPWSPKRCGNCKTFGHSTLACPIKPKQDTKLIKQEWKVKEQHEENEWQKVKKNKDKSIPTPKESSKDTPQASSNMFEILQSCKEDECKEEDKSLKLKQESKDDEVSTKQGPKQANTTPPSSQAREKKLLLDRIQKLNSAKEQALASISQIKESNSKQSRKKMKS